MSRPSRGRRRRGGCFASLFNILTVMLVAASAFIFLLFILLALAPQIFPESVNRRFSALIAAEAPSLPTAVPLAEAPTLTPTFTATPAPLVQPTWTQQAEVSLPTSTFAPLNTSVPSRTPTTAPTLPPSTPTRTPTPIPTDTPTPGPSPTVTNTRAPFQFTKTVDSPFYLQNFANTAGCNWMGVAGEVLNLNGQPVAPGQYRVHIWDSGVDERAAVGGASAYGPSGWEQFLFDSPIVRDYNVQLETVNGTPVSQVYRVQSRASCNQNLIIMNFVQNY